MNIVIAIIIMTVISFSLGYNTNTISMMSEDSALKEAGLMVGDKIVSYDKKHVFYPSDLSLFLYVSEGEPVEVSYRREGVKGVQQTTVTPKETAPVYLIGVSVGMTDGKANNIIQGVEKDRLQTWQVLLQVM